MADEPVLHVVRVVDRCSEIAGPYCTKLLADAGADVVKVEPAGGDPLRRWRSGGLFEFLSASKRSITGDDGDLVAAADILVTDQVEDVAALRTSDPGLVVVTITPFGLEGPWVDRPWTEFTLQAACGSTGQRGLPERTPLAAGGRLGEWVAGTYAALGAVAAHREARRTGVGVHVDVAILDCMAVAMVTYPTVFSSFLGRPPMRGTGRTVEVPSVEPTKDGYAVFTTNSAQQFRDFLVMIDRPDLLDDAELAQAHKRFARRHDFLAAVRAYTEARTTDELLEEAAMFRIPAAPVLDGGTIPDFEQFRRRGVFASAPSGRFLQPRVPYRISGAAARRFSPAPEVGADVGSVDWLPDDRRRGADGPRGTDRPRLDPSGRPQPEPGATPESALPLRGVRIVDCTAWWAGPSATHALACLGADVVKVESTTRPDQMRFAGTRRPPEVQWWEWGPIHHGVNVDKRGITIDLGRPEGIALFERLVERADVLVENWTPRVMDQFGQTWDRLHARNPALVMVRMPAFGLDGPWRDRTGFAQTMECLTGMAWLTGSPDGPPVLVRGACDPVAGIHAAIATVLALQHRDRTGEGTLVEVAMVEAALNVAAEQVIEHTATGTTLTRDGNRGPVAAPQGVYACAGEDRWVAVAVATDDQWRALCAVIGRPEWADGELASARDRRRRHDEIDDAVAAWTAGRSPAEAVAALDHVGVPSNEVVAAPSIADNPQLRARGLFETEDHPVTGRHEIPMLPFRYSGIDRWLRSSAPTLGQHNDEVFSRLGFSADEIGGLRTLGVIGERPAGA
jgi:crotonobetainyl-CoA:carnitine CoA-transferase CaiB-like acyl-CoA transferase